MLDMLGIFHFDEGLAVNAAPFRKLSLIHSKRLAARAYLVAIREHNHAPPPEHLTHVGFV
jgi:hypothetical protein